MSQEQILKKKNYQNVFHNQESIYKIIEIIESKENVWLCATEQHVVVRDTAGEVGTVELGMDCCAEHKICFHDQFGRYISDPDWTHYIILDLYVDQRTYPKPYCFTLSTCQSIDIIEQFWRNHIAILIDILNVMINLKTFHIAEIQALRWTNSSGTWWTNHSDHCFHEKMMRQLTSSLYTVFMRTLQSDSYFDLHAWMFDIQATHPLNPGPEHQVRHPHL